VQADAAMPTSNNNVVIYSNFSLLCKLRLPNTKRTDNFLLHVGMQGNLVGLKDEQVNQDVRGRE